MPRSGMRSFALAYAALHDLGFAPFHLGFTRIFNWPVALAGLDHINRGIVFALNQVLTVLLAAAGALLLWIWWSGTRDATSVLMLSGLGAVWLFRAALQPIHWGARDAISRAFIALFLAGGLAHLAAAWAG